MNAWFRLLCCVCLLASAGAALGQQVQIEVLVFAYSNPDGDAALSADDADPDYRGMLLGEGGEQYSTLPRESLKLAGANDALARHARTRALLHVGWQQNASASRSVRLRGARSLSVSDPARGLLGGDVPELDGDLSIRSGRGIEVTVDALLRVAGVERAGRPGPPTRFRLNSRRVLSYGELHYLDHPALGVIVRIDPVSASDSSP